MNKSGSATLPTTDCQGFSWGESGPEANVIFINKQFVVLRLSNAETGGCEFFSELFNAGADRTILLPWSSRVPAIRQLIFGG